jgi:hypothetical protein
MTVLIVFSSDVCEKFITVAILSTKPISRASRSLISNVLAAGPAKDTLLYGAMKEPVGDGPEKYRLPALQTARRMGLVTSAKALRDRMPQPL